jgi:hypothetical protein
MLFKDLIKKTLELKPTTYTSQPPFYTIFLKHTSCVLLILMIIVVKAYDSWSF